MKRLTNPFTARRSEQIDDIPMFLSLFEPGVLEVLNPDHWYKKVHLIRSAQGGGKSSLLRLFTPAALNNLHLRQEEETLRELHQKVCALGALEKNSVRLLGVKIACGRNYAMLQELDLDAARKLRLFFSLLNSRIVLATVRAVTELQGLDYPQAVGRITIDAAKAMNQVPGLSFPCDGSVLLKWGADIEERICDALDSFGPLHTTDLPGHEELFSLDLINPERLRVDGNPVASQTLLMMDDVHTLTNWQRKKLIESLIEHQSPIGIWIAERFEALSTSEMLASGAVEGRDYHELIAIEPYWRKHYNRFEKNAMLIAKKRVRSRSDVGIDDFAQCLSDSLEGAMWTNKLENASAVIQNRIQLKLDSSNAYQDWYKETTSFVGSIFDQAIAWRSLEILIARHENRTQLSLLEEALPVEQLKVKKDGSLRQAAKLFLAKDFKLPYYFGVEQISRLASLNIQQFLGIAADLFEDVLARDFQKLATTIPPDRQHELMKAAARRMWEEIPRTVKHGREVRNLLDGIGNYARDYTYRPTAPNDPGVAGSGIRMAERTQLLNLKNNSQLKQRYERFSDVLASAMSYNLITPDLDYKCKNDYWMVLNLNRLLCVHYDLPLGYGLYKEQSLQTLNEWIDEPFIQKQRNLFP